MIVTQQNPPSLVVQGGNPGVVWASFTNSAPSITAYTVGAAVMPSTPAVLKWTLDRPRGHILGAVMLVSPASGTTVMSAGSFSLQIFNPYDWTATFTALPADNGSVSYKSNATGRAYRKALASQITFVSGGWTNGYGMPVGSSYPTACARQVALADATCFDISGNTVSQNQLYGGLNVLEAFAVTSGVATNFDIGLLIDYD